jgi:hypothetical protein
MEIRNTSGTGELRLNQSGVSNPQGMTFYTTNVKRMAITPSGDVNIGEAVGAATTADISDEDGVGTQEIRALTYPATITAEGRGTFNELKISGENNGSVGLGKGTLDNQGTNPVSRNTAVGFFAAANNAEGTENTSVGAYAGMGGSGLNLNACTFIGYQSGFNAGGSNNTGVGRSALSDTTGEGNTAIGSKAGQEADDRGTFVGHAAGHAAGYGSTLVGFMAGTSSADALNVTALGYSAGRYSNNSYELFINSLDRTDRAGDVTKSIIYGKQAEDVADQKLTFNADVTANSVTIPNQSEPPTPTGGGTMFVQDGALKFIGSAGTITTIGQA